MEEYIFERNELIGKNIFEFMTDFSKFLLKNKKINFYDFMHKETRIVDIKYTINVNQKEKNTNYTKVQEKLFNYLNSAKTLISNVSAGYLKDYSDKNNIECVIILKTNLAPTRENFDDFICRLI